MNKTIDLSAGFITLTLWDGTEDGSVINIRPTAIEAYQRNLSGFFSEVFLHNTSICVLEDVGEITEAMASAPIFR